MPGDSIDIYQEGLRLPPVLGWRRGVPQDTILKVVAANSRAPAERWGDLLAQAGEAIKQGRFARIRGPNECNRTALARDPGRAGLDGNAASRTAMAHRAAFRAAAKMLWMEMYWAVSLRSATSAPSTQ